MHDWQGGVIELAGRCDIRDVEIHDDVSYSFFRHEGISWLVGRDFHRVGAEVVAVQIVVVEETYNLPLLAPHTHTISLSGLYWGEDLLAPIYPPLDTDPSNQAAHPAP
jgi:hypothetical protein